MGLLDAIFGTRKSGRETDDRETDNVHDVLRGKITSDQAKGDNARARAEHHERVSRYAAELAQHDEPIHIDASRADAVAWNVGNQHGLNRDEIGELAAILREHQEERATELRLGTSVQDLRQKAESEAVWVRQRSSYSHNHGQDAHGRGDPAGATGRDASYDPNDDYGFDTLYG